MTREWWDRPKEDTGDLRDLLPHGGPLPRRIYFTVLLPVCVVGFGFVLAWGPVVELHVSDVHFPAATGGLASYFVSVGALAIGLGVGSRNSVQVWGWGVGASVLWRCTVTMSVFGLPAALGYAAMSWSGSDLSEAVVAALILVVMVGVATMIALVVQRLGLPPRTRLFLRRSLACHVGLWFLYAGMIILLVGPSGPIGDWAHTLSSVRELITEVQGFPVTGWAMWVVDPRSDMDTTLRLALLAGLAVVVVSGGLVAARWPGRTTPMSERKDQWT